MARRLLSDSARAAIWRAHSRRCVYCTEPIEYAELQIDHVLPIHLGDDSPQLTSILKDYEIDLSFDLNSPSNFLPCHSKCNRLKRGIIPDKSSTLHYLMIAREKLEKVSREEQEILSQARKDNLKVLLQIALQEQLVTRDEINDLLTSLPSVVDKFELLHSFPQLEQKLTGFISRTDIEQLYDREILPRPHGLDALTMEHSSRGDEVRKVKTCREWVEARRQDYVPASNFDLKEESFFKALYALIVVLAVAKEPSKSFISAQGIGIGDFELLPVSILPALTPDDFAGIEELNRKGITMADLVDEGQVEIVSRTKTSIDLHFDYTGILLYEIIRADFNEDGVEDVLVGCYTYATQGTLGVGASLILTRLGEDQDFARVDNIHLSVD